MAIKESNNETDPEDDERRQLYGRRRLAPTLQELDTSEFVTLAVVLMNSDAHPGAMTYTLILEDWTEEEMNLQVNFVDPMHVSQGVAND